MNSLIDGAVLSSIFNSKYLDFQLCCQIESVSSLFRQYAQNYYEKMTNFDLNVFEDGYFTRRNKNPGPAFDQLIDKLYFWCKNLKTLKNLESTRTSCNRLILALPLLSNVHFIYFEMVDKLKPLFTNNLAIKWKTFEVHHFQCENVDVSESDLANNDIKIKTEKLYLGCVEAFRFFQMQNLQTLHFSSHLYPTCTCMHKNVELKLIRTLQLCLNMEKFKFSFFVTNEMDVQMIERVLNVAELLPKIRQIRLQIGCLDESQLESIVNKANLVKLLQKLTIYELTDSTNIDHVIQLKQLKSIKCTSNFCNFFGLLFQKLPKLEKLENDSLPGKILVQFEGQAYDFAVKSTMSRLPNNESPTFLRSDLVQIQVEHCKVTANMPQLMDKLKETCHNIKSLELYFDIDNWNRMMLIRNIAEHFPQVKELNTRFISKSSALLITTCFRKLNKLDISLLREIGIGELVKSLKPFAELSDHLNKINLDLYDHDKYVELWENPFVKKWIKSKRIKFTPI